MNSSPAPSGTSSSPRTKQRAGSMWRTTAPYERGPVAVGVWGSVGGVSQPRKPRVNHIRKLFATTLFTVDALPVLVEEVNVLLFKVRPNTGSLHDTVVCRR